MASGIYCIENVENGKQYIGKSEDIERRMWDNHQGCTAIERTIKKHKNDGAIIRYIIEYCEIDEIFFWERYYIKEWKTKTPNGYNMTEGGDGPSGRDISEETRKKMSKNHANVSGENNPNFGKYTTRSEETKKLMRESAKNRPPVSDETRRKQSESLKGEKCYNFGKHLSEETKEKQRKALSGEKSPFYGKHPSCDTLELMRIVQTGKKRKNSSSKYYGVSKKIDKKIYIYWRASVVFNGKKIHIKQCKIEIEAARAYDRYVIEHNLPNPLNFSEEWKR